MRLQDSFIIEASYPGNIGAMEVFKFYQTATQEQKAIFDGMVAREEFDSAWEYLQEILGVNLHPIGKK